MTIPSAPPGLLPPGPAHAPSPPPMWQEHAPGQNGSAPMQIERMPERSLSVEMSRDRARLFVLSGGVLGVLLVVMLIVLLSPAHTLLSFGQTAPAHVPTATPTPAERMLFTEPLTSTSDRNWPNNDQCSQRADGFHISANVLCILNRYTPPPDVNISVAVRQAAALAEVSYGTGFHRPTK